MYVYIVYRPNESHILLDNAEITQTNKQKTSERHHLLQFLDLISKIHVSPTSQVCLIRKLLKKLVIHPASARLPS